LKTLHIIGSAELGGAERFALRLINALHENGWETAAVLRKNSALEAVLSPTIPRFHLGMRTPLSRWRIQRIVKTWQPAIVQTYMGRATALTHLPRSGAVVHLARLGGYYSLKRYRHAHGWIGNTQGLCRYLIEQGLPADKVFHLYNFIDPPATSPSSQFKLPELPHQALILLAVGRLHPVKGLNDLLQAFAQLPESHQGRMLYLVLVGAGPQQQELQAQADQLGITERIHWAGWQNNLAPYYQAADLVVFPSLEQETLGNVILEAWTFGKPLLTSNSRGARELCTHQENAWCVPCKDVGALADGILHILNDPKTATQIARAGQEKVQAEFSRERIVGEYQSLYLQLSKTSHPPASAQILSRP